MIIVTKKVLLTLFLTLTFGCTNEGIYRNIQEDGKRKCQTLPQAEYQECMKGYQQSYEDYERSRKELKEKDNRSKPK